MFVHRWLPDKSMCFTFYYLVCLLQTRCRVTEQFTTFRFYSIVYDDDFCFITGNTSRLTKNENSPKKKGQQRKWRNWKKTHHWVSVLLSTVCWIYLIPLRNSKLTQTLNNSIWQVCSSLMWDVNFISCLEDYGEQESVELQAKCYFFINNKVQ